MLKMELVRRNSVVRARDIIVFGSREHPSIEMCLFFLLLLMMMMIFAAAAAVFKLFSTHSVRAARHSSASYQGLKLMIPKPKAV